MILPNPLDATPIGLPLRILGFFKGIPRWVYIVLGVLAVIGLGVHLHGNAVRSAHDAAYAQGVSDTKDAFARAQARADAAQRAHIAKTVTKQTAISQESTNALAHSYSSIDDRAHALSVRHAAARDRASQPGAVSAAGDASAGAQCQAAADGLPWDVALPVLTQAAKNLAQLNAVLDWEAKQDALAKQEPTP